jgi:hypothetical protein
VTECPGTVDGVACTHTGRKRYNEARCCFCTDNLKADQLTPEDYHHKYETIGSRVRTMPVVLASPCARNVSTCK